MASCDTPVSVQSEKTHPYLLMRRERQHTIVVTMYRKPHSGSLLMIYRDQVPNI